MKPTEQLESLASAFAQKCDPLNQTLEKQADLRQGYKAGFNEAISQMQPEWVSVEQSNPEPKQHYFALCNSASGKMFKCVVVYTEGWDLEVDGNDDGDHFNLDEVKEMAFMKKGWYEECEQDGHMYDNVYFKRDVAFILTNIETPQPPIK